MMRSAKSVITLSVICLILAALLALVNAITAPVIADNERAASEKALLVVYPDGSGFEKVELGSYPNMPKTVTEIQKSSDGGYVVKLTTSGHKSGLVIMCGIDPEGTVVGAICLASSETYGKEKTYGDTLIGKDIGSIDAVDTIAGATKTTAAYKNAVKDALGAVEILGGGSFDNRTEEEIALDEALPEANGEFVPVFVPEDIEGLTALFRAGNNSGYVFVFGDTYIGTDGDGNVKTSLDSEYANGLAEKLDSILNVKTESLSVEGLSEKITSVERTEGGSYIFTVLAEGYGIKGKKYPSGEHIVIKISVSREGRVICCTTVSEAETEGVGDVCAEYDFYKRYNGTTSETYDEVDAVSGATVTSVGYTEAVGLVLSSLETVLGGNA